MCVCVCAHNRVLSLVSTSSSVFVENSKAPAAPPPPRAGLITLSIECTKMVRDQSTQRICLTV